jgi:hypothetical protein
MKVFICLCPYFQSVTLTGPSNNPSKERNFYSLQWNTLSEQSDRDMEIMNGS